MSDFKRNIYRTVSDDILLSTPHLVIQSVFDSLCFGTISIRVNTTVPVKINMTSTFDTGASYYTNVGYRDLDIINEVISETTIYQFGIEASNGGTLLYNSSINFTINDFTTDALIDAYTLTRSHEATPC